MKKITYLCNVLMLTACTGLVSYGKAVDENTAKTIGANYLIINDIPGVQSAADLSTVYTATAKVKGQAIVDYYVFNVNNGKGYVMVSGDDNIIPILSYSNDQGFDYNHMAPPAKGFVIGYANEITAAIANNLPAEEGTPEAWANLMNKKRPVVERTSSTVFPSATLYLLKTLWDQAPYYNQLCPVDHTVTPAANSVTGCVATSMSQIMKYWNWPTVGTGQFTYTDPTTAYGPQTFDYGNTAFQWGSMPNQLLGANIPVATLMYASGVSVMMNYTANESGAYVIELETPTLNNCAEYALKTYFHYNPKTVKGIARSGENGITWPDPVIPAMSQTAWQDTLESELNANRPVSYSGAGAVGGHNWVCDGWNTGPLFHMNWGWSGLSNGWFTVNALAPSALGTGGGGGNFNTDQCMIKGIIPDSFPNTAGTLEMAAQLDCPTNSSLQYLPAYTTPIKVITKVKNAGTASWTGNFTVQVFDTLNNLVGTFPVLSAQTIAAGATTASMTFSTTNLPGMIPEVYYHLELMYQKNASSAWIPVANNTYYINYNILAVVNPNSTLELTSPIVVTSGSTVTNSISYGAPITSVVSNVGNIGGGLFPWAGDLEAVLINTSTGAVNTISQMTGVSIPNSSSIPVSFSKTTETFPSGLYALAIEFGTSATGPWTVAGAQLYENPVLFTIKTRVGVNTVTNPADNVAVFPNPANDVIHIMAADMTFSMVRIMDIQGREIMTMAVDNQSNVTIPVNDIAPGMYLVQLQTGSDVITKKIVIAK